MKKLLSASLCLLLSLSGNLSEAKTIVDIKNDGRAIDINTVQKDSSTFIQAFPEYYSLTDIPEQFYIPVNFNPNKKFTFDKEIKFQNKIRSIFKENKWSLTKTLKYFSEQKKSNNQKVIEFLNNNELNRGFKIYTFKIYDLAKKNLFSNQDLIERKVFTKEEIAYIESMLPDYDVNKNIKIKSTIDYENNFVLRKLDVLHYKITNSSHLGYKTSTDTVDNKFKFAFPSDSRILKSVFANAEFMLPEDITYIEMLKEVNMLDYNQDNLSKVNSSPKENTYFYEPLQCEEKLCQDFRIHGKLSSGEIKTLKYKGKVE